MRRDFNNKLLLGLDMTFSGLRGELAWTEEFARSKSPLKKMALMFTKILIVSVVGASAISEDDKLVVKFRNLWEGGRGAERQGDKGDKGEIITTSA
ncbi:MAG: hypothetical protein RMY31_015480 [Dendronalium sp. ChiSLP03b]